MNFEKVSFLEGMKTFSADTSHDKRGSLIKFQPTQGLAKRLDSVLITFNPRIGTIRGLHFQIGQFSEEKLVTCIQGAVFDVVFDLRPNSTTFGKWASIELSAVNNLVAYLPKGIAHGFQTLMPDSVLHYSLTSVYSPESAFSINPFAENRIDWPIQDFLVSDKDRGGLSFESGISVYTNSLESQ